jgi:hypothetical protein
LVNAVQAPVSGPPVWPWPRPGGPSGDGVGGRGQGRRTCLPAPPTSHRGPVGADARPIVGLPRPSRGPPIDGWLLLRRPEPVAADGDLSAACRPTLGLLGVPAMRSHLPCDPPDFPNPVPSFNRPRGNAQGSPGLAWTAIGPARFDRRGGDRSLAAGRKDRLSTEIAIRRPENISSLLRSYPLRMAATIMTAFDVELAAQRRVARLARQDIHDAS